MAEPKTRKTTASARTFIDAIPDERKRKDCRAIATMMRRITGQPAKMWGTSIVGFGSYHYQYASGREGDWPLTGFSPRAQNISLYIMAGFKGYEAQLKKLGKHKTGKSCLYINKLDDIDLEVLEKLIGSSVDYMREKYPSV